MRRLIANDGVGWNAFDRLALTLLPSFFGVVGYASGDAIGGRWVGSALTVIGAFVGLAVVRGLQAVINSVGMGRRDD